MTIRAIAIFNEKKVKGQVCFTEDLENNCVHIDLDLQGLKPNFQHGFHVHEYGDLSDGCESMCNHFNPYGKSHGGKESRERHVGDLGNLISDKNGCARYMMRDNIIQLRGSKCNILGRGLIIHADPDDCGQGGEADSLTTGHAGKRIACAVIGYAKENYK
jgi:Cu-Zn family superoxide dismutase